MKTATLCEMIRYVVIIEHSRLLLLAFCLKNVTIVINSLDTFINRILFCRQEQGLQQGLY